MIWGIYPNVAAVQKFVPFGVISAYSLDPKVDETASTRRPIPKLRPRLMATTPKAKISLPKKPMSNSALYSVSSYMEPPGYSQGAPYS